MKTENKTIKTTAIFRNLRTNAGYTNRFINKTAIGEQAFRDWSTAVDTVRTTAFEHYKALAGDTTATDTEKAVYTALKTVLSLVGDIPTADGKECAKIPCNADTDGGTLFLDIMAIAVNRQAKVEKTALVNARTNLRNARNEYRKNCLTENGMVKAGLQAGYIKAFTDAIDKHTAEIERLLNIANNSVHGTEIAKKGKFAKDFEIVLKKVVLSRYNFTAEQVKAEREQVKAKRNANRTPKKAKQPEKKTA